jgi:hypothetical protein
MAACHIHLEVVNANTVGVGLECDGGSVLNMGVELVLEVSGRSLQLSDVVGGPPRRSGRRCPSAGPGRCQLSRQELLAYW